MIKYRKLNFSTLIVPEYKATNADYGNMLEAGKMGGYHQFLKEKHEELGPIFFFWILKDRVVSLGHPKYWSAVGHLQDRSAHIRMFLRPLFGTAKTINLANGPDRAERYRKYITPLMNKETVDAKHSLVFKEHTKWMFEKWNKMSKAGEKIPVNEHFCLFVLANMLEILFGVKHTDEKELLKLFEFLTYCVVNVETKTLNLEMDSETEKQIKEKVSYIHNYIRVLIRNRINENPEERTCLVDFLKLEHDEDVIFTDSMTFFFGSIHTTIAHLTFTVFHLANNLEKQDKLQEELDKYVPSGKEIGVDNMRNLKYLRACVNESLRLTPPVSTSARIDNENDITLPDGFVIPKNTPIILPLALVLGDKELWDKPDQYIPERFRGQGIQYANQFSPFGFAGGRVCAGKSLAQLESQMIIGNIFKNFRVTLSKGQGPLNLYYLTGTTPKEEIFVDFNPRY